MINSKVLELFTKYADERNPIVPKDVNVPAIANHEQLENYGYELQMKFRTVLIELEHDISLLKIRGFDNEMLQLLIGIWRHLEKIYVIMKPEDPIKTAHQIVQFLNDKHTKSVIDNLIFLSEHHIKSTNVEFTPATFLKNSEVRGLRLLLQLKKTAEEAPGPIPLPAPPNTMQETWRPPSTQSMQAIKVPAFPPLKTVTPLPELSNK